MNHQTRPLGVAGGTLSPTNVDYVVRPSDALILAALRRRDFCYVLSSRQMGKSSLLARATATLRAEGWRVVPVDMTTLGTVTRSVWYQTLCEWILDASNSVLTVSQFWSEPGVSDVRRFCNLISALAAESPAPLAIVFDEIDSTIPLPFTDDFFASLRSIHNERAYHPELKNVVFALAGVAAPHELIKDKHRTPFNIGQPIDVTDFTAEEAAHLLNGSGAVPQCLQSVVLGRILHWTGGQPYLTHLLCRLLPNFSDMASESDLVEQVDKLVATRLLEDGNLKREAHLSHIAERLRAYRGPGGRRALQLILMRLHRNKPVSDKALSQPLTALKLAGVVRVTSSGMVRFTNEAYRRTFSRSWVSTELRDVGTPLRRAAVIMAACMMLGVGFATWFYPNQLIGTLRSLDRDTNTAKALHGSLQWFPWQRTSATNEYVRVLRARIGEDLNGLQYATAAKAYKDLAPWDPASRQFMTHTVEAAYNKSRYTNDRIELIRVLSDCGIFEKELHKRHLAFLRLRIAKLLENYRPSHYDMISLYVYYGPAPDEEVSDPTAATSIRPITSGMSSTELNRRETRVPSVGDEMQMLSEIVSLWNEQSIIAKSLADDDSAGADASVADSSTQASQSDELTAENWPPYYPFGCFSLEALVATADWSAKRLHQVNDLQGLSLAHRHIDIAELKVAFHRALMELIIERASELAARERSDLAIALLDAYDHIDPTGRLRLYQSEIRSARQAGLVVQIPLSNGNPSLIQSMADARGLVAIGRPTVRSVPGDGFTLFLSGRTLVHYDHSQQSTMRRHHFEGIVLDAAWHASRRMVFISTSDGRLSWYRTDSDAGIESTDLGGSTSQLLVLESGDLLTVSVTTEQSTRLRRWNINDLFEQMGSPVADSTLERTAVQLADVVGNTVVFTGFGKIGLVDDKSLSVRFRSDQVFDFGSRIHFLGGHGESRFRFVAANKDGRIVVAEIHADEDATHHGVRILQELCPSGRIVDASKDVICIMPNDQSLTLYERSGEQYLPKQTYAGLARLQSCALSETIVGMLDVHGLVELVDRKSGQRVTATYAPQARHLVWHDADNLWMCGSRSFELWDHRRITSPLTKPASVHDDTPSRDMFSGALVAIAADSAWRTDAESPSPPLDGLEPSTFANLKPIGQFPVTSSSGPGGDNGDKIEIHQLCSFKDPQNDGRLIYCGVAHDRGKGACRLIFFRVEADKARPLGQCVVDLSIRRISDTGFATTSVEETGRLWFAPDLRQLFFIDRSGELFGATVDLDRWRAGGALKTTASLQRLPLRTDPARTAFLNGEHRTIVGYATGAFAFGNSLKGLRNYSFPIAAAAPPHLSVRNTLTGECLVAEVLAAKGMNLSFEVPLDESIYDQPPMRARNLAPWKINELGLATLDDTVEVDSIPLQFTHSCFGCVIAAVPGLDGVLVVKAPEFGELKVVDMLGNDINLRDGDKITGFQRVLFKDATQQMNDFCQVVTSARSGLVRLDDTRTNRESERFDSPFVDLVRGDSRTRCRLSWGWDRPPTSSDERNRFK